MGKGVHDKEKVVNKKHPLRISATIFIGLTIHATTSANDALPLGDGKVATQPTAGYVYRCGQGRDGNAPRMAAGPWIQGQYWYPNQKPTVRGDVRWPQARISFDVVRDKRVISTNALPNHSTGVFPIQTTDPAYRYDRNPNRISEQTILMRIPANPTEAATPNCLRPGPIGYMLTGVALFDALDANSQDAPAHEVQDRCSGHPQQQGQYHYHNASDCLIDNAGKRGQHSDLVGYAADGFGIYGLRGENGLELTNNELDVCHGHAHTINWDGKSVRMYHYHMTRAFPYSLSCFKGTAMRAEGGAMNEPRGENGGPEQRRPQDFRQPHRTDLGDDVCRLRDNFFNSTIPIKYADSILVNVIAMLT